MVSEASLRERKRKRNEIYDRSGTLLLLSVILFTDGNKSLVQSDYRKVIKALRHEMLLAG